MSARSKIPFALRHPLLTLESLLVDGDARRMARVIALTEASRRASGLPSVLDELEEYLELPRLLVTHNVARGPDLVASRWNLENPQTPDQVREFYRHCFEFLYDLTLWNMDPTYRSLLSLLDDEHGGVCLSFAGGIGTEALHLAAQQNEVWYCDVPDSPVWKFAHWRTQQRSIPIHLTDDVPEGTKFDCAVAFSAFSSLTSAELEATFGKLAAALKTGGRLYCDNDFRPRPTHPYLFDHGQLWESLVSKSGLVKVNERLYVKGTREGAPQDRWNRAHAAGKE